MLSIIICSRRNEIDSNLFENIKKSIGCDYELIVIDNSKNQKSIFDAYNLGIEKSKGEFLCFMHDDILVHTNNWGNILELLFNSDANLGLIGVAGAKIKSKIPSAWWDCPHDQKAVNMIQHFSKERIVNWNYGFEQGNNVEVVTIDGVFMAMRKNEHIQFDTKMKGFHNYDLNISLEHKKNNYKIIVTNEILIEHFSLGNLDENWLLSTLKAHKIYTNYLPISIGFQDSEIIKLLEIKNAKRVIKQILSFGLNRKSISLWFNFFSLSLYSKFYLEYLNRIFK
jgi:hypothetical protein